LPLGYGLGIVQNGGPQALWIGLIAGLMIAAVLLLVRFLLLTRRLMAREEIDAGTANDAAAPEAAETLDVEEFVRIPGQQ
jgi:hypothetical protein